MQDKEISVLNLHTELLRKQKKYEEDLKSANEKMNRVLNIPKTDSNDKLVVDLQKSIVRKTKFQGKFDAAFNESQSKMLRENPNYEQLEKNLVKLNGYIDKNQKEVDLLNEKIAELENNLFNSHEASERFVAVVQQQKDCQQRITDVLIAAKAVASRFNLLTNAPGQTPAKAALYQGYVDSISQSYQDLVALNSQLDQAITDYLLQTNLSYEDKLKTLNDLETQVTELEKKSEQLENQLKILQADQYKGKNLSDIKKSDIRESFANTLTNLEKEKNDLAEQQKLLDERIKKLSKGTVRPQKTTAQQNQRAPSASSKQIDFDQVNNLKNKFPSSLSAEIKQRTEKLSGFTEFVRDILIWYPAWAPFYEDAKKFVEEQDKLNVEIEQIEDLREKISAIPDNSRLGDDSVVAVLDFWQALKEDALELSMHTNLLDTLQSAKGALDVINATQQYDILTNQIASKQEEIKELRAKLTKFDAVPEEIDLSKVENKQVANHAMKSDTNNFSIFSQMFMTSKTEPDLLPPELEEFVQAERKRQAELESGNPFELYSAGYRSKAEAVISNRNWPVLSSNEDGNTMLHLALKQNHFDNDMIKALEKRAKLQDREFGSEQWKEIVSTPNKNGETPLLLVVANEQERSGDKEEMVKKLITAGAKIDEKIVQKIITNEDHYMMEVLMEQDPSYVSNHVSFSDNFEFWSKVTPRSIDVTDKNGHTLLYAAIEKEDFTAVNKLITFGAKVSDAELNLVRDMKSKESLGNNIESIWAKRPLKMIENVVKEAAPAAKPQGAVTPTPRIGNV